MRRATGAPSKTGIAGHTGRRDLARRDPAQVLTLALVTLGETLTEVWRQVLVEGRLRVELADKSYPVTTTMARKLRVVRFDYDSHHLDGIEQNPQTGSRWALLASEGKRIMQFSVERRYIGNVSEGQLTRYPAWHAMGLPE